MGQLTFWEGFLIIIPEALLVPISLLLLIFLSILWARKSKSKQATHTIYASQQQQQPTTMTSVEATTLQQQPQQPVIDYGEISIQKPTIAYYKRIVLFILLMLAGVFYPCFISIPYYLLYFFGIFLFTFKVKMDSHILYW